MARKALGPATLAIVQAVRASWPEGEVFVGCSGGADSLALAFAAARVARERGGTVTALIVDHGLQPGSAAVAAGVAGRVAAFGAHPRVQRVEVTGPGGMEAAAREARYQAFTEAAGQTGSVLLGHTLDDQAETVLLGLARGSGLRSLAGMAPVRGMFVRPLLGIRSATTSQACEELGLVVVEDPHNADPTFARVRVRRTVLPLLEDQLGGGIAEALARTATLARADADALDALAVTELARLRREEPDVPGLSPRELAALAPAVATRVLRLWLLANGAGQLGAEHVTAVWALVADWHGQKGVDLPGLRVIRQDGRLQAVPHSQVSY